MDNIDNLQSFGFNDEAFPEEKYDYDIDKCNQVFVYGTLKTGGDKRSKQYGPKCYSPRQSKNI